MGWTGVGDQRRNQGLNVLFRTLRTLFLALLYNVKMKHSKIKRSMDTLVTREILTNFTSLLNGQMSCNGLSITVVNHFDQAL